MPKMSSSKGCDDDDKSSPKISPQRRKTVCGPSFDPKRDGASTEIHPKEDSEIDNLQSILRKVHVLADLDGPTLTRVILTMEMLNVAEGQVVITQNDDVEYFYVIESGTFEATHSEKGKTKVIATYSKGNFFGEVSLLHNQLQNATVTAKTAGKLWALSRTNFKKTVVTENMQLRYKYTELLSKVEILQNLSSEEKLKVSEALVTVKFSKGESIIKLGDEANGMYFIEEGRVTISIPDKNDKDVVLSVLKPGDYFGELALLTHQPRAANAVAETDVVLAFLNVEAFERLLGSCDKIMRRNAITYEKQMKKLFKTSTMPTLRK